MAGIGDAVGLGTRIAALSFRRYATYRAATLAGAFTNSVFGVINAYVLLAVWRANPGVGGYDAVDAVTFVWLSQGLLTVVSIWRGGADADLSDRIRSGDVVLDLQRPVSLLGWYLAADLGRAAYHLVTRGVVPVVVGALLFDLRWPHGWAVPAFLLAVLLGVVVSFSLRMLVALSGFWLLDDTGLRNVLAFLAIFLSGLTLPLVLFPGVLGTIAFASPFAAYLQLPADLWLGTRSSADAWGGLGLAAAWAAVGLVACSMVLRRATAKVVVQGG